MHGRYRTMLAVGVGIEGSSGWPKKSYRMDELSLSAYAIRVRMLMCCPVKPHRKHQDCSHAGQLRRRSMTDLLIAKST